VTFRHLLLPHFALLLSGVLHAQASVVILGTGTPNPDPERSGPGVAVVVNGTAYLVDAGAGIMRRANAAAARHGLAGLRPQAVGVVLLSHLHSDHTIGLADVIHTGWVAERARPLRVFGPPGTAAMAEHLTAAYQADIENRTTKLQPHTPDGWRVEVTEMSRAGVVHQDTNVTVTAIEVPHDGWQHAFGFRFEGGGRVIVVSGDTRPSEAVVTACNGCDVLIHEVYSAERLTSRPPEWQRYHTDAHTSTTELASLAARARPKLLVLYHQLYWGATDEDLIREIRAAGYQGPVVSASDLARFP
jgi:ribonuclease BN (tRNA processing enzyme)